jgi:hypothetical protein
VHDVHVDAAAAGAWSERTDRKFISRRSGGHCCSDGPAMTSQRHTAQACMHCTPP